MLAGCGSLTAGRDFLYGVNRRTHLKRLQNVNCASNISVAVLAGAARNIFGGGARRVHVIRFRRVLGCQQRFQQTGSITLLTLACLRVIRQNIASGTSL